MDKVLAVNSGSSSLKFKLFEMPSEAVIASGLIERIAIPGSQTTIKYGNGKVYKHQGTVKNHGEAVNNLMELLISLGIIEKKHAARAIPFAAYIAVNIILPWILPLTCPARWGD